jgi:hypothetical protein
MSKSRHGAGSALSGAERQAMTKLLPFIAPYFLPAVVVGIGGLFHKLWADTAYGPAIAPTLILLTFMVLAGLAWKYAAARQPIQRAHVTASVAVVGLWFYVMQVVGFKTSSVEFVLVSGLALAISWTIRRLGVVLGEGKDDHGSKDEPDWHGLKRPRKWAKVEETPDRTVIEATLAPGQGAKDALNSAPKIGSELGTIHQGVRVIQGDREGQVKIQMYWEDLGKRTHVWEGPVGFGQSIQEPIPMGVNESGSVVPLYLLGDSDQGIARGNLKLGGITRSGKGVAVMTLMANVRCRKDVFPMISDHAKGEQLLGLLRGGLTRENSWIANSDKTLLGQAKAIQASIRERNKALGECGYSSWRPAAYEDPRLQMPAIVWFIEEFGSSALVRSPQLIINIGNECLSAGIVIVLSMQRLAYDQIPTSFRSAFSQGICFGVEDDTDAKFVLHDESLSTGVSPGGWGVKYPGRFMCSLNGVSDEINQTPARTYFGMTVEQFEAMVKGFMDSVGNSGARLDPVTRSAFGPAYEAWVSGTDGASDQTGDDVPAGIRKTGVRKTGAPQTGAPQTGVRKTGAHAFDPTIQEDEMDLTDADFDPTLDDPDSEMYLSRPQNPDEALYKTVDPRDEIKPSGLPEVDMSEPDRPGTIQRVLTKEEKAELFAAILDAHRGEEMRTATFIFEWRDSLGLPEANRDPAVSELITLACEEGRLERLGRGAFKVPA